MSDPFDQAGHRVRLGWGRDGVRRAAAAEDVVVVVDVLSFSSAVVTAVQHGGVVLPCAPGDDAAALAATAGAQLARKRREVPALGRFSLSPLTYLNLAPGTAIVLPSPNGAACCRAGAAARTLLVGCLLNASAVAAALDRLLAGPDVSATVVACGERWAEPGEDGPLRFAVEDYLGAGAILARLNHDLSPEARVCAGAFRETGAALPGLIQGCGSGRELDQAGYGDDVRHAARLDCYDVMPVLRGGQLECW